MGQLPTIALSAVAFDRRDGLPEVILLSGDRHLAEISRLDEAGVGYPLYEITSSGLTHS